MSKVVQYLTARRFLVGGATTVPWLADAALALLRLFAGLSLALAHGWGKIPPHEGFVGMLGQMGFPVPTFFAWCAALAEFAAALLVAAGLFTRPAALIVAFNMAVAGIGFHLIHAGDPYADAELAMLFMAVFFAFIFIGGGRFSIDRLLR